VKRSGDSRKRSEQKPHLVPSESSVPPVGSARTIPHTGSRHSAAPGGRRSAIVVDLPRLGVVERHRACKRQLEIGDPFSDETVGLDHSEWVLPGVEASNLRDERLIELDIYPTQHLAGRLEAKREVLRLSGSIASGTTSTCGTGRLGGRKASIV
jgi:hypothetical protein